MQFKIAFVRVFTFHHRNLFGRISNAAFLYAPEASHRMFFSSGTSLQGVARDPYRCPRSRPVLRPCSADRPFRCLIGADIMPGAVEGGLSVDLRLHRCRIWLWWALVSGSVHTPTNRGCRPPGSGTASQHHWPTYPPRLGCGRVLRGLPSLQLAGLISLVRLSPSVCFLQPKPPPKSDRLLQPTRHALMGVWKQVLNTALTAN